MMVSLTNRGRKAADLLGDKPDRTSSILDCLNDDEPRTQYGYLQRIIEASSDGIPITTAENAGKREPPIATSQAQAHGGRSRIGREQIARRRSSTASPQPAA